MIRAIAITRNVQLLRAKPWIILPAGGRVKLDLPFLANYKILPDQLIFSYECYNNVTAIALVTG